MSECILVNAPSRLHFGLFGGESHHGTSFGGVGAMIDEPGIELQLSPSSKRIYAGQQVSRLQAFTEQWIQFVGIQPESEVRIELKQAAGSHIGLGTGTQLGLSVAAALFQHYYEEIPGIDQLALSVQRGKRSAVGTHGFLHGGLIVDRGKKESDALAQMDLHLPFPPGWCFVLIKTAADQGLSGAAEDTVFDSNWTGTSHRRRELVELAQSVMVPAVLNSDFAGFSQSIQRFGELSGDYFSRIQGGPYNGPRITEMVDKIRRYDVDGVGQSSWGPTVYALLPSRVEANLLMDELGEYLLPNEWMTVAIPSENGAAVRVCCEEQSSNGIDL
ncbi:MAG: hypothetical protein P8M80_11165 [Pirellulaceae bacterium]|nr:hypothetical protein [Pirellulaceae bacterium]